MEQVEEIRASGWSPDALDWLLSANHDAKGATKEADASRFLASLRTELTATFDEHDPARYDFLSPPAAVDAATDLLATLLQRLGRDERATRVFIDTLGDDVSRAIGVAGLPAGFDFPAAIQDNIRIRYDQTGATLRFRGLMTDAERVTLLGDPSLLAVTGVPSYLEAIEELFQQPRLALKFFEPRFFAPLADLPMSFDNLDDALARKITFDARDLKLVSDGILTVAERVELINLSADPAYLDAVNSLFTQPRVGTWPSALLWMQEPDLLFPLRSPLDPNADHLKDNLAAAIVKALAYLGRTTAEQLVVRNVSAKLGLRRELGARLLTAYPVLPETLLEHLTGAFALTSGAITYAAMKPTFDAWLWTSRVAAIWVHWRLSRTELDQLAELGAVAPLFDFQTLPLDSTANMAPLRPLLRTAHVLHLRDTFPETDATLLAVMQTLSQGGYPTLADWVVDAQRVHDGWAEIDLEQLAGALDSTFPTDYLVANGWARIQQAVQLAEQLNASPMETAKLAAPTMTEDDTRTVKELLRSAYETDAWLTLSEEIQNALRERKRNALSVYLLTQAKPDDAPSGKWENENDLYAYYLLDVEMSACMFTSRLVQASGSVQLFVQRCHMGLEPDVVVDARSVDGDSAWRWWEWLRKYRVWEANRKVFLWPENWIEPELKKDRSPFFKDLENELLQKELNPFNVENAFTAYVEKLRGVAQLEVAGFYQEDDGDNTIVHVFGRTPGVEPHMYYYRRYDYRQWTPWEKVDLDIKGDYLVPAVINKRLFLFWPLFVEVADEEGNATVKLPDSSKSEFTPDKTTKRLEVRLAVSDFRRGKWTPTRVSTDSFLSEAYTGEISRDHYRFLFVESPSEGRVGVQVSGFSLNRDGDTAAWFGGTQYEHPMFAVSGCGGVPTQGADIGAFGPSVDPEQSDLMFMLRAEKPARFDAPDNHLTVRNARWEDTNSPSSTQVLTHTPGLFNIAPAWHQTYFDRMLFDGQRLPGVIASYLFWQDPLGTWAPFFYADDRRTFFALPTMAFPKKGRPNTRFGGVGANRYLYYPDIKRYLRKAEASYEGQLQAAVDALDVATLSVAQRAEFEASLLPHFLNEDPPPPWTDDKLGELTMRLMMRIVHRHLGWLALAAFYRCHWQFKTFYHPLVCQFAELLHNPLEGITSLMRRQTQMMDTGFLFSKSYQPEAIVVDPSNPDAYPREDVDFSADGAYASYNWELFYHAPLLIGQALSRDQRFAEARDYYHMIFNPAGVEGAMPGSPVSKYWITKPFFLTTDPQYVQQRIENIMHMLAGDTTVAGYSPALKESLEDQVFDWRTNPFEPHRIANYRTVAYQKTVFMKYLDNLISWGDHLFRQDSMESINEATQLYVLAAELLGPRPKNIPPRVKPPTLTFNELEDKLDVFSNALVEVENLVPVMPGSGKDDERRPSPLVLYFCIPHNNKMLGYWDTVADRLFKIRHCMNIDGVVRQLALFQPPIDPGALVKAVAAGVDIGAALADLNAPLPLYRFNVLLQKANELCSDVKSLGGALLSTLEKKDAEALRMLRQGQEIGVLQAIESVREQQILEADEQLAGLLKSKELVTIRRDYYREIEKVRDEERLHQDKLELALMAQQASQLINIAASVAHGYPNVTIGAAGFGGTPTVIVEFGGANLGQAMQASAGANLVWANSENYHASKAAIEGSRERRWAEWKLQEATADKELEQLDTQIAGARLRISIATRELENHRLQVENAKTTEAFMRNKYTSIELYQWQLGQISDVYFQSYNLARDLAGRAERCFRFELGLSESNFITAGYWDSLKGGLLAGEKLQVDLRRLETSYLEQNRREFELTKQVSVALTDPLALIELRETGRCFLRLPEELFDHDFPGHYFRRIKSVSLSLPCVSGPHVTISCTLRLLKNRIRVTTATEPDGYPRITDEDGVPLDDARFIENNISAKAIATSSGSQDSGVFELNFRDERYLPYEGAGVISDWSLELMHDAQAPNSDFGRSLRQFDYGSITDAVLHIRYTAREDAGAFKNAALEHLRSYLERDDLAISQLAIGLRREFDAEWDAFLQPDVPGNVLPFEVSNNTFPERDRGKKVLITAITILARCTDSGDYEVTLTPPLPEPPPAGANTITLVQDSSFRGLHVGTKYESIAIDPYAEPTEWRLRMRRPGGGDLELDATTKRPEVEDVVVLLTYHWETP